MMKRLTGVLGAAVLVLALHAPAQAAGSAGRRQREFRDVERFRRRAAPRARLRRSTFRGCGWPRTTTSSSAPASTATSTGSPSSRTPGTPASTSSTTWRRSPSPRGRRSTSAAACSTRSAATSHSLQPALEEITAGGARQPLRQPAAARATSTSSDKGVSVALSVGSTFNTGWTVIPFVEARYTIGVVDELDAWRRGSSSRPAPAPSSRSRRRRGGGDHRSRHPAFALAMNARTSAWSFTPGADSTPLATSTPKGRNRSTIAPHVPGVQAAGEQHRLRQARRRARDLRRERAGVPLGQVDEEELGDVGEAPRPAPGRRGPAPAAPGSPAARRRGRSRGARRRGTAGSPGARAGAPARPPRASGRGRRRPSARRAAAPARSRGRPPGRRGAGSARRRTPGSRRRRRPRRGRRPGSSGRRS